MSYPIGVTEFVDQFSMTLAFEVHEEAAIFQFLCSLGRVELNFSGPLRGYFSETKLHIEYLVSVENPKALTRPLFEVSLFQ